MSRSTKIFGNHLDAKLVACVRAEIFIAMRACMHACMSSFDDRLLFLCSSDFQTSCPKAWFIFQLGHYIALWLVYVAGVGRKAERTGG